MNQSSVTSMKPVSIGVTGLWETTSSCWIALKNLVNSYLIVPHQIKGCVMLNYEEEKIMYKNWPDQFVCHNYVLHYVLHLHFRFKIVVVQLKCFFKTPEVSQVAPIAAQLAIKYKNSGCFKLPHHGGYLQHLRSFKKMLLPIKKKKFL